MLTLPNRMTAVLLASVLAACGGGGGDSDGTTPTQRRDVVGNVVDVLNQQALVDGRQAAGGDTIPAGAVLSTDDGGAARFSLRNDPTTCEIRPSSEVEVLARPDLLLRLIRGSTLCDRRGARSPGVIAAPGAMVQVGDSGAFAMGERAGGSAVSSYEGCLGVAAQGGQRRVCQNHELDIPITGPLGMPRRFNPERRAAERAALARLRAQVSTTTTTTATTSSTGKTTTSSPVRTTTSSRR